MGKSRQLLINTAFCIKSILDIENAKQNANDLPKMLYVRDRIKLAMVRYLQYGIDELLESVALWDRAKLLSISIPAWDDICDIQFEYEVFINGK